MNDIKTINDAKFAAFEKAIDDQFERYFAGELPRHKLRKWLVGVCHFTIANARAEIVAQLGVRKFTQDAELKG